MVATDEARIQSAGMKFGAKVESGTIINPGGDVSFTPAGDLAWEFDFEKVREVQPTPKMFHDFRWLYVKRDTAILHFAKRWAPLRVKADGSPETAHSGTDPLHLWKVLSRRADAVMKLAACLKQNRPVSEDDLRCISTAYGEPANEPFGLPDWHREDPFDARTGSIRNPTRLHRLIAGEISVWLKVFPVRFRMEPGPSLSWRVQFDYNRRLTSALALQLALSVSQSHSLYVCCGCGLPYIRDGRAPNAGQGNYCPGCGKDAREQSRNRRTSERRLIARRMFKAGHSIEEIAKKIEARKPETVLKMVQGVKTDA